MWFSGIKRDISVTSLSDHLIRLHCDILALGYAARGCICGGEAVAGFVVIDDDATVHTKRSAKILVFRCENTLCRNIDYNYVSKIQFNNRPKSYYMIYDHINDIIYTAKGAKGLIYNR